MLFSLVAQQRRQRVLARKLFAAYQMSEKAIVVAELGLSAACGCAAVAVRHIYVCIFGCVYVGRNGVSMLNDS